MKYETIQKLFYAVQPEIDVMVDDLVGSVSALDLPNEINDYNNFYLNELDGVLVNGEGEPINDPETSKLYNKEWIMRFLFAYFIEENPISISDK